MIARMAIVGSLWMLMIQLAPADSIEFRSDVRRVTALEASDGAPAGGIVYQHFVTTDADILSVNAVTTNLISGGCSIIRWRPVATRRTQGCSTSFPACRPTPM